MFDKRNMTITPGGGGGPGRGATFGDRGRSGLPACLPRGRQETQPARRAGPAILARRGLKAIVDERLMNGGNR